MMNLHIHQSLSPGGLPKTSIISMLRERYSDCFIIIITIAADLINQGRVTILLYSKQLLYLRGVQPFSLLHSSKQWEDLVVNWLNLKKWTNNLVREILPQSQANGAADRLTEFNIELKPFLANGTDFIPEIHCLSQFYGWGKLTVSVATNHTWTAALSRDQEQNLPVSAEQLCLFNSPKFKPADLAVTKDTVQGSREGQGGGKKGHWQDRLLWNHTEYSARTTYRTQWDGLIWIWDRNTDKWAHCPNNLSHGSLWTWKN